MKHLVLILLTATALTACAATNPGPQSSGIDAPSAWSKASEGNAALTVDASAQVEHQWWTHFADPALDA